MNPTKKPTNASVPTSSYRLRDGSRLSSSPRSRSDVRNLPLRSRCWLRFLGGPADGTETRSTPRSNGDPASSFEELHKCNTVVVDEVDYLIETAPNPSDEFKREKEPNKIPKYLGPARQPPNKPPKSRMIKPDDPDPTNTPTPMRIMRHAPTHSSIATSTISCFSGVVGRLTVACTSSGLTEPRKDQNIHLIAKPHALRPRCKRGVRDSRHRGCCCLP